MGWKAIWMAGAVLAGAAAAGAEEMTLGAFEYQNSCAACHGATGKGDGPLAGFMQVSAPPDLTMLQKNNGGVFPVSAIYATIEGSDAAGVHGSRDMPVWGARYRGRMEGDEQLDYAYTPGDTEAYVQARILALIEHLSSLQVQ